MQIRISALIFCISWKVVVKWYVQTNSIWRDISFISKVYKKPVQCRRQGDCNSSPYPSKNPAKNCRLKTLNWLQINRLFNKTFIIRQYPTHFRFGYVLEKASAVLLQFAIPHESLSLHPLLHHFICLPSLKIWVLRFPLRFLVCAS